MGALKNISLMINILLIVIGVKLLLFQSDDFNLIIFLSYYYFFFRTRELKNVLTDFSEFSEIVDIGLSYTKIIF